MLKRGLRALPITALIIYSAILLWIEGTTSQEYVRRYFTDIGQPAKHGFFAAPTGDTVFYAVNTSLSSFLLGAAAILMFFAAAAPRDRWSRRDSLYAGQGAIFLWLSLDDRFMFHEHLGAALGIPSTVILATTLLINLALYAALARPADFNRRMLFLLICAGAAFAFMMLCDLVLPHEMYLRLSLEDLAKTWAGFAFLSFAWETARFRLIGQPAGEESLRLAPAITRRLPQTWAARLNNS